MEINELIHELVTATGHIEIARYETRFETFRQLHQAGERASRAAAMIAGHLEDAGFEQFKPRCCSRCGQHKFED